MPGKTRLAKHILGSCLETKDAIIEGRHAITYVIPSLREPVGFYLLIDGEYEIESLEFVLNRLSPGAVFVDIGANIGAFTLPAARRVGSSGCVISVEPSPRIFPYLKRNVALNKFTNVRLVQCAVHNRDGETVPFYEAPVEKFGMGSLGAQFDTMPVPVLCHTLDSILNEQRIGKVDLIKVDVEGFESAVFEGAEKLLTSDRPPFIIFEFCDWAEDRVPGRQVGDAQRILRRWGYRIWRLHDTVCEGRELAGILSTGSSMLVAARSR